MSQICSEIDYWQGYLDWMLKKSSTRKAIDEIIDKIMHKDKWRARIHNSKLQLDNKNQNTLRKIQRLRNEIKPHLEVLNRLY